MLIAAVCCTTWCFDTLQVRSVNAQAKGLVVKEHSVLAERKAGQLFGNLRIPTLQLSVPLLENDDAATLRRGVGHLTGTAEPGGFGNLVLAGHRDTFFRPLRSVRPGMEAEVITEAGRWRYVVDRTEIVDPSRIQVLTIGERPEMTLITCYPFQYIGSAPQRFIVHAHLLSLEPES